MLITFQIKKLMRKSKKKCLNMLSMMKSSAFQESSMLSEYIESTMWAVMIFIHAIICHKWKASAAGAN